MSTQIPNELTQQQALEVLVSGVQVAQQKGAYNLQEAELISKACRVFIRPVPQEQTQSSEEVPQPPPTENQSQELQTPQPPQPLQYQKYQDLPPVNDPQNIQTI